MNDLVVALIVIVSALGLWVIVGSILLVLAMRWLMNEVDLISRLLRGRFIQGGVVKDRFGRIVDESRQVIEDEWIASASRSSVRPAEQSSSVSHASTVPGGESR